MSREAVQLETPIEESGEDAPVVAKSREKIHLVEGGSSDEAFVSGLPARYEGDVRDKIEVYLRSVGFVVGECDRDGSKVSIVDVTKLHKVHTSNVRKRCNKLIASEDMKTEIPDRRTILLRYFGNDTVFSKEDAECEDAEPRPLFYIPESIEQALDPSEIKKARYHVGLWEILSSNKKARHEVEYPVTHLQPTQQWDTEADVLTDLEVRYSMMLWGPNFGDAYRNEQGELFVKDPATGEHAKLTYDILKRMKLSPSRLTMEGNKVERTLQQGIRSRLPHLEESGLLLGTDFHEVGHMHNKERFTTQERKVSSSGLVMFNRVSHYVGKKYHRNDIRIVRLSDNKGAVYEMAPDGGRRMVATFSVHSQETAKQTNSGAYYAGPEKTHVEELAPEHLTADQMADEHQEQWTERVNKSDRAAELLPVMLKDLEMDNVYLNTLSFENQMRIAQAGALFNGTPRYKNFLTFVKRFQHAPMECFDAFVYGAEYGERLLMLSESIGKQEMVCVLTQYAEIARNGEKIGQSLVGKDFDGSHEFKTQFSEALMRRSKDIINVLWATSKGEQPSVNIYGKKQVEVSNMYDATEALSVLNRVVTQVSGLYEDDITDRPQYLESVELECDYTKDGENHTGPMARFHHFRSFDQTTGRPVHVAVQLRERGVDIEHKHETTEFDGEARINFLVDFEYDGGDIHDIEKVHSEDRGRAFSFRIDRESMDTDKEGNITHVDAGREKGNVSLDVGSLFFRTNDPDSDERLSDKVGRIVAVGNSLSSKYDAYESGKLMEMYHNRRSFSDEFGNAEQFQKITRSIEKQLMTLKSE